MDFKFEYLLYFFFLNFRNAFLESIRLARHLVDTRCGYNETDILLIKDLKRPVAKWG